MARNIIKDLGVVTAYAYAVSRGYTGTEIEFAQEIGNASINAQAANFFSVQAADSATNALSAKDAAVAAKDAAVAAAATASSAYDVNLLAPNYTDLTFPVKAGQLCIYSGGLYKAKQDIETSESWTAAHWEAAVMGDELARLDSALQEHFHDAVADASLWESGAISSSSGENSSGETRIRTKTYLSGNVHAVSVASGYEYIVAAYSSGAYQGMWNGSSLQKSATWRTDKTTLADIGDYQFRLVLADSSDSSISASAGTNCVLSLLTDDTLSISGKAADAAIVGAEFGRIQSEFDNVYNDMRKYSYVIDASKFFKCIVTIDTENKYYNQATHNPRGSFFRLPDGAVYVSITVRSTSVIAFLSAIPATITGAGMAGTTPSFSTSYPNRITFTEGGTVTYRIKPDMKYLYFAAVSSQSEDIYPTNITVYTDRPIIDQNLYPYTLTDIVRGGIYASTTGKNASNKKRLRTNYYHEINHMMVLNFDPGYNWVVAYYDSGLNYLGYKEFKNSSMIIKRDDMDGAMYARFLISRSKDGTMNLETDAQYLYIVSDISDGLTSQSEALVHDIPENNGVLNVINRAYQMGKLSYTAAANLPTQQNTNDHPHYFPEGEDIVGVPYSSVRNEALYVPQCISLHSFMTAALNPNSYLYTHTEPEPHYNALTYNGAVCSSLVAWCYGIDNVIPTTHSFATYPGMELLEDQSPYLLKLGDMLNRANTGNAAGHIVIVTDIMRNKRGKILKIEITEQTVPKTRIASSSPEYIQSEYFDKGYKAYRYRYIYKVPYTPSPWINLDDETDDPEPNKNLCPRRGDKANWRLGDIIEIDVLDAESYTGYKLYEDDVQIDTGSIPASGPVTLTGLTAGVYKLCLTDGTDDSGFVYFNIISTSETYTPGGSNQVTVSFSSDYGTPASIVFCEANPSDSDYKAVVDFHVLTDAEITAGEATVTATSAKIWLMRVFYKTEFGLYASDFASVTIT